VLGGWINNSEAETEEYYFDIGKGVKKKQLKSLKTRLP